MLVPRKQSERLKEEYAKRSTQLIRALGVDPYRPSGELYKLVKGSASKRSAWLANAAKTMGVTRKNGGGFHGSVTITIDLDKYNAACDKYKVRARRPVWAVAVVEKDGTVHTKGLYRAKTPDASTPAPVPTLVRIVASGLSAAVALLREEMAKGSIIDICVTLDNATVRRQIVTTETLDI